MSRLDNLDHRKRVALSTVAQTAANLIAAALGVVGVHLATGKLGPNGYGQFLTVVSFVTIFTYLNDLGISVVGTRELAKRPDQTAEILGENLTLRATLSLTVAPIITGLGFAVYSHRKGDLGLGIALMSADLLFNATQTTAVTFFAARVRNDVAATVILLSKVVYVGMIGVMGTLGASFLGYVGAYLIGDFVGAVVAVILLYRRVRPDLTFDLARWKRVIVTSVPLGILQIISNVYFWNGSIILSLFRDPSSVAFYGLSINVLLIVGATSGYFMTALVPALSVADEDSFRAFLQSAFDLMIVLAVPVAVGGFLLRHQLIVALAGHRFSAADLPFGLLVIGTSAGFINNVFSFSAIALSRLKPLLQVQLPLLGLNIALGCTLVPHFGTTGEAVVVLVCEGLAVVAIAVQFARLSGMRVQVRRTWRVLVAGAAMVPLNVLAHRLWATGDPYLDALIGVVVLSLAYTIVLALIGGLPPDLRRHLPRRRVAQAGPPT